MEDYIVSLEDVWVYFDNVPVLEGINLSVKQNTFLAIIGPNGGGKTTLLRVILGLVKPEKGIVKVFGKKPEEVRKFVGYVPQYISFERDFPISVFDAVLIGRYKGLFKSYSKEDKEAVMYALESVGMLEFKDRQINQLSGGQLQRVLIARAITRNTKLLLLDEPTASIDQEMQKSFYELISKLKEKMTIILVTHDIGAVSVYVDEIACLNRRLNYHGPKEKALKRFVETYKYPIELIAHGFPTWLLSEHDNDRDSSV